MSKFKYKIEQKCKYLDDLGLKPHQYGTNFTYENEKRAPKWKKQRKKYGFDERETWALDSIAAEFLYTRCKMYLDTASKIINLSFYKFEFEGKTYTQEEAIKQIIEWLGEYIIAESDDDSNEEKLAEAIEKYKKAFNLFAEISQAMWW